MKGRKRLMTGIVRRVCWKEEASATSTLGRVDGRRHGAEGDGSG